MCGICGSVKSGTPRSGIDALFDGGTSCCVVLGIVNPGSGDGKRLGTAWKGQGSYLKTEVGLGHTDASDSCSSFLASIRSIAPYLDAGWSRSGLHRTNDAQTWSTISFVLRVSSVAFMYSLQHVLFARSATVACFQSEDSSVDEVDEISTRQIL